MKVSHARLAVAAVLFLGWLGWLAYLVVNCHDPVILSRPQFLVADLWVVADLEQQDGWPAPEVMIRTVTWSKDKDSPAGAGLKIVVENLPEAGAQQGWAGPGEYILALSVVKTGKTTAYQVTRLPPAPYVPAFQILKQGPEKEQMVKLLGRFAKLAPEEATRILEQQDGEFRNFYEEDAGSIISGFERYGAAVAPAIRIYSATPAARKQLDALLQEWKK
jgi:hypothetical protein